MLFRYFFSSLIVSAQRLCAFGVSVFVAASVAVLAAAQVAATPASRVEAERDPTSVAGTSGAPWVYRFHDPEWERKYLRYAEAQGSSPAIGRWPATVAINWRYNDAGRPSGLVSSQQAALDLINLAMSRWTAQCGVRFNYQGTTTNTPGLATTSTFDSVNVIGWGPLSGNTTGVTGVGGTGTTVTEGDIVLNNVFNPSLLTTIIHEIGHFLGLRHSDVSNVMMSGPPLTSYSGVSNLQTDDIDGCRSLFGSPTATTPSISGTATLSSGGNALEGTQICANPSAGVSCTSTSSGNYSCTVPSGWTGTLHLQAGNNSRVAAKRFAAGVTNTQSGQNFVVSPSTAFACNLDIDNNGLNEAAIDGVMILRKLFGVTGNDQAISNSGACAQRTSVADKATYLNGRNFDINGSADTVARPHRDGIVLLRLMLGIPGTAAVAGTGLTWSTLQGQINSACGTGF